MIGPGSNTEIILEGENYLAGSSMSGLCVYESGRLTISESSESEKSASLFAQGGDGAGIGGGWIQGRDAAVTGGSLTVEGSPWIEATSSNVSISTIENTYHDGVVFEGNTGTVYGDYTLNRNYTLPADRTLTIEADGKLTVEDASTLTNKGTLKLSTMDDTLTVEGSLAGEGVFQAGGITDNMIIVPKNLAYNGGNRTEEAKKCISIDKEATGTATIYGKEFNIFANETGWSLDETALGTVQEFGKDYTVKYTKGELSAQKTFQLVQSVTEITASADNESYTYGDTITITAQAAATGEVPANNRMMVFRSAMAPPTAGQMVVYYGDTQISEAVSEVDGKYTMTVDNKALTQALTPLEDATFNLS